MSGCELSGREAMNPAEGGFAPIMTAGKAGHGVHFIRRFPEKEQIGLLGSIGATTSLAAPTRRSRFQLTTFTIKALRS
jgi:hypothetical protein